LKGRVTLIQRALLAAVLVVLGVLPAAAAPITITYTFDVLTGSTGDQASEPVDSNPTGVTASDITRGPGLTANAGDNSINSRGWTFDAFRDLTDYYELTLTPTAGFALDVDTFEFTYRRSATGPQVVVMYSSLDAFTAPLGAFPVPPLDEARATLSLSSAFDDQTSPVTFRIYGYAATFATGTFRLGTEGSFDACCPPNLQITGDASLLPVPEPATFTLLAFGLVGVGRRRWRQRQAS
jgi:hypothetical protein